MSFDFHASGRRVNENVQFFDSNTSQLHAWVRKANGGDPFRECLGEPNVAGRNYRAHTVGYFLVIHDSRQFVSPHEIWRVLHPQVDIDAYPLRRGVLVRVHPDAGGKDHVAQENMAHAGGAVGDGGHGHSSGATAFWTEAHCIC